MEWLQKNQTTPIINHHPQSKFLARKAQTTTLLASARTEEEYLQIVQNIIQSQDPKTVLSQSSSSDSTSPAISLGVEMKTTALASCHLSRGTKKKVSTEKYKYAFSSAITYKRRHPLTKGVSHFRRRWLKIIFEMKITILNQRMVFDVVNMTTKIVPP
jgi:phenylalanyl-tRNA synthetase alpha subunit